MYFNKQHLINDKKNDMGCYYQEDACSAMYFILPTGKNTVLLRTVLSIKSRSSEWKFKDAITVFVTYVRAA